MREIRFKAWHLTEELMYTVEQISWTVAYGDWYGPGVGRGIFWINKEFDKWSGEPKKVDSILIQNTGLKDKHGVEIYEGDIIEQITLGDDPNPTPYIFAIKDIRYISGLSGSSVINEVIGNKFENPELLKQ